MMFRGCFISLIYLMAETAECKPPRRYVQVKQKHHVPQVHGEGYTEEWWRSLQKAKISVKYRSI